MTVLPGWRRGIDTLPTANTALLKSLDKPGAVSARKA